MCRHQRLPGGLKSNFVGLSSLHNMDEDLGFEDVLDSECFCFATIFADSP